MLTTALDLVPVIEAIEKVKTSKLLTDEQRKVILSEIVPAIPAPVFCKQCPQTLSIINKLVETTDGRTKEPPKEDGKGTEVPKEGKSPRKQPTRTSAQNARGTSKVSGNAKEPKEQGRSSSKRT